MSTTASIKKINTFHLTDSAVAFGLTLIAVILIGLATVIGFNLGVFESSFWLGLVVLYFVGIAVYVMWWVSHPTTKKWPGFALGVADLIIAPTVLVLLWPGEGFQVDKFGWGILDAVLVAVLFALIKLYGKISRILKSKSTK
ncbi:MAG: hypothetical protein EOT05_00290 [Candidatus Microsaccharimonas sossegonensis]|uniref:Uncharacterized protein n=1 Tax=Candidatus Microsaccharimonas sossegonensis TaxID=2506948 RepID=A0A4V1J7C4_9BACT|nr:MAG: hypothetical protein EOT05_00290 [Candidatus Microsaccharimonas sossegonensis]